MKNEKLSNNEMSNLANSFENNEKSVKIIVLYENHTPPNKPLENSPGFKDLQTGWGFGCLIQTGGKNIMFDCGWSSEVLDNNIGVLKRMGLLKFDSIDYVIISHQHWDHMGALEWVLSNNPGVKLILPSDFSKHLTGELKRKLLKNKNSNTNTDPSTQQEQIYKVKYSDGPFYITDNIYATGDIKGKGNIGEQGLVINTKNDSILITGCLHPDLKFIYELTDVNRRSNVWLGGAHGFSDFQYLKSTNLNKFYLGHCTQKLDQFEKYCKDAGMDYCPIHPGFIRIWNL